MKTRHAAVSLWRCALIIGACVISHALQAQSGPLAQHPIVAAVGHQRCAVAISLIHTDVGDNDAPTAFLAGRMLDEGVCVQRDPELATHFFARAADLGLRPAVLDYAAKAGLGVGTGQDFARAGELCHAAGLDAQKQLPDPTLGYACTVAGLAGRLLRERLPPNAFVPAGGAVVKVEFVPGSGALQIISVPKVARGDSSTGSYVQQPLIKADQEITRSWQEALKEVSAPEAVRADTHAVALSIDVDMTLERGRAAQSPDVQPLMPGDIHPGSLAHH